MVEYWATCCIVFAMHTSDPTLPTSPGEGALDGLGRRLLAEHGAGAIYAAAAVAAVGDSGRAGWVRETLRQASAALRRPPPRRGRPPKPQPKRPARSRGRPRREIDRGAVIDALRVSAGNVRAAARRLRLPRTTVGRCVVAHGLLRLAQYPAGLSEAHTRLLVASGISPDVARARGYRSVQGALEVPVWSPRGERLGSQLRIDAPSSRRRRYRNQSPPRVLDVSPAGLTLALDPRRRLYVTESPRKADAAVSLGIACVAVLGVRELCLDADEWARLGVKGREVCIVFDADAATNPEVMQAEGQLRAWLQASGACVRVVRLPGPAKMGLDDYLAAGHGESDLLSLAE